MSFKPEPLAGELLPALRVAEITRYLQNLLESDPFLARVKVEGELSNYQRYPSGHHYFDLKERVSGQEYLLSCVMFAREAAKIKREFKDGMLVTALGRIRVYPARGRYQLYVEELEETGRGELFQQFLALKEKLEKAGLFAPERKKPLPSYPGALGVVTSSQGAALRDILTTLKKRHPGIPVYLSPAQVQGEDAPDSIIGALERLRQIPAVETVILARGGGSFEDLNAFNRESLALYLAQYPLPLITGVGHETDFTIADFLADHRAPTPTAAAQTAVPELKILKERLREKTARLFEQAGWQLAQKWQYLDLLQEKLQRLKPQKVLEWQKQTLFNTQARLKQAFGYRLEKIGLNLKRLEEKLEAFSPLAVLKRGYSITRKKGESAPLKKAAQTVPLQELEIILSEGRIISRVERII